VDPFYTRGALARVFLQSDDEPCTLIEINLSTGGILLIDFTKMPGPNDFGYDERWHSPHLVDGAWCEATARKDDSAFGCPSPGQSAGREPLAPKRDTAALLGNWTPYDSFGKPTVWGCRKALDHTKLTLLPP
jgi:hypothetical protein